MSDEVLRGPHPSDDAADGAGWFAYAPVDAYAAEDDEDTAPVIRSVDLRPDEYAGPFWDEGGSISDEFDELHRWTGLSRELYDDAMAWNEDATATGGAPPAEPSLDLFTRQQELLRRLATEVHPGITVTAPRDAPATQVLLSRLRCDEPAARLVIVGGSTETGGTGGPGRVLPPVPGTLLRRVQAWSQRRASHATARPSDEAIFAWEDEGAALARDLQDALGDDYAVLAR